MNPSHSIWHLLHNVKSTVKISSIFVAFLEHMNFIELRENLHFQYISSATYLPRLVNICILWMSP